MNKTKPTQPQFRHWLIGSLQRQFALTFGSVSLLMMLGLTGFLLKQQQAFLDDASIRRAGALANGLAYSSSAWVLANDVVGLNEILQGYLATPNLERAFILNNRGEVLASTKPDEVGFFVNDNISLSLLNQPPSDEPQALVADDSMIDIAAPIKVNQQLIGWTRIELNQQATRDHLKGVLVISLKFTLLTTLIVLIVSSVLARFMSRRLQHLTVVARKITDGERNVRAKKHRDDEIGHLANNINQMLDTITHSESKLDRLNHVYAAWTESVATIVREADEITLLNRVCGILAEKIDFRLVIIGFTNDHDDWVDIVASSNWNASYLKGLKISRSAFCQEGRGPLGRAIREKQAQILNDFLAEPGTEAWREAARAESIHAAAAFPLFRGGKVVGGISVYSEELYYFDTDVISLLSGLAADVSFALDNFDRELQRQQTATELALAASVFENSQEGVLITDAHKTILRVNQAFSVLTGYSAEQVIGKTPNILASGQHDESFYKSMWQSITDKGYWQGEIINRRHDENTYQEWLTITTVKDKNDQVTHYVGTFIDITDRKINEERIHNLAFYDPLTQLPNRRLLIDRLRRALVDSQRSQRFGSLMFMDMDRFKVLNDSQGHDIGDQLLIEVGQRISHCVRAQDTVARLGGDEFVIMLEDLSEDVHIATSLAKSIGGKIVHALRQPYALCHFDPHGHSLHIEHHSSASIGVTLFCGTSVNVEVLLRQADVAMYQAKQAGRNTLCLFDPNMQSSLNQRAALETDMRQALQNHQFYLHYQVQTDQKAHIMGAEVLLRWEHPKLGAVSPAEFIPLAEETGLIVELGRWVLAESCKTLAAWAERDETRHLVLAVNVSAKQFSQSNFVQQVKNILDDTGAKPQNLKLEITESIVLEDIHLTINTMHILRDLGIHFSMDDFGTGYSSLSYLQRLPLSQLKIDQSFVRDLASDGSEAAIIRTILALGKSLNIDVVAEGVETVQQRDYLAQNGCEYFQGYLFGKPEPLSLFEGRLRRIG